MLSIQPLQSAKSAGDYYCRTLNYYQGNSESSCWLGESRKYLNLPNEIEKATMLQMLQGILPNGTQLQNFKGEHRPGFDMTFSAPKSVSILVGLNAAPELVKFHDEAVKYAISKIESEFAEARVNRDGIMSYEKTGNLLVAVLREPSSRANDPALHTHCVTMNLTFLNGEAKSLSSDKKRQHGVIEQIQNNAHYCGLLYRHHLANSLKEAGFTLRLTQSGLFEIDGIAEHVLRTFSSRREDIEQLMREEGWEGAKAASKATVMTRQNKKELDLPALSADWQERAKAIGFDADAFVKERHQPLQSHSLLHTMMQRLRMLLPTQDAEPTALDTARACLQVAIETLSQRTSVFSERMLKTESLKHSLTHDKPITLETIEAALLQEKKSQNLYESYCPETNQSMLTTPWLLTLETETITRIENNKGAVRPITNAQTVAQFQKSIDEKRILPMTSSQKEAMAALLTSTDRYVALQGYAGVAKTTMLSEARVLMEAEGYLVRGITVPSSAANELQTKAHIKTDVFPIVHQELKQARKGSLSKTVFIADESSMLSSPQGHELIKHIELTGARLFLVGDKAQLPSVNSGRIFSLTQEYGIETAVMNEIVRQKDKDALKAVEHATKGEVRAAMDKLSHVEEKDTHSGRIEWIANKWLSLTPEIRKETLLFAPTHANRAAITELLREGLEKSSELRGAAHTQKTLVSKSLEAIQQRFVAYYQTGDTVRFNQDFNRQNIKQGHYYSVGQITKTHRKDNVLPLVNEEGKTRLFPLKTLPQYKTHTASFERLIEVYHTKQLELKEGDSIIWCRNFKNESIRNGQRATLQTVRDKDMVFSTEQGNDMTLSKNHPALKHLDYGYVLTNYKVQGKDALYGIGLMESHHRFSATLKNFYVQISRAVMGMTLVTDSRENLIIAIERNDDEKKASLDMITSKQLIEHDLRFNQAKHSIDIRPVIDKKIQQELVFTKAHHQRETENIKELER